MAPLEKRPLGRNGPLVSKQGLGCMGLSGLYASALELTEEQKIAFLKKAVSEGVTLFNSANIYVGPTGHNEVRQTARAHRASERAGRRAARGTVAPAPALSVAVLPRARPAWGGRTVGGS